MTVLDLENWSAGDAIAELVRKTLKVRLNFKLTGAPGVRYLASVGRGNDCRMVPTVLAVEYSKVNDEPWAITTLRMYGHVEGKPDETALNIYPHDRMFDARIPAWVRDAAYAGMPDRKKEDT